MIKFQTARRRDRILNHHSRILFGCCERPVPQRWLCRIVCHVCLTDAERMLTDRHVFRLNA